MTFSKTIVAGNVGAEPKFQYTQSGVAVMSFSIAEDRGWFDKEKDAWIDKTQWWKITLWREAAERLNNSGRIYKGRQVLVEGQAEASAWVDQSGDPQASLEMTIIRTGAVKTFGKNREGNGSEGPPDNDRPFGEPGPEDVVPTDQPSDQPLIPASPVYDDPDA